MDDGLEVHVGEDVALDVDARRHFGREEPEFTWEDTSKAAALRAAAGL
jgi:S-adenosylmethionine synthetase